MRDTYTDLRQQMLDTHSCVCQAWGQLTGPAAFQDLVKYSPQPIKGALEAPRLLSEALKKSEEGKTLTDSPVFRSLQLGIKSSILVTTLSSLLGIMGVSPEVNAGCAAIASLLYYWPNFIKGELQNSLLPPLSMKLNCVKWGSLILLSEGAYQVGKYWGMTSLMKGGMGAGSAQFIAQWSGNIIYWAAMLPTILTIQDWLVARILSHQFKNQSHNTGEVTS